MNGLLGFAALPEVTEPLREKYVPGYFCRICGKPLQASPMAVAAINTGSLFVLCMTCGKDMNFRLAEAGVRRDTVFSEDALLHALKNR